MSGPTLTLGTSGVPSAAAGSAVAAVGCVPGPDEIVVKKAALVMMQKQMAASIGKG